MSKQQKQRGRGPQEGGTAEQLLNRVAAAIDSGNFTAAMALAARVVAMDAVDDEQRAEAWGLIGLAAFSLQDFERAFEAFSETVALQPQEPAFWYNRAMASRLTSRLGRSLRDLEQALALATDPKMAREFDKELNQARQWAEDSRSLRGREFTLEQLIEQEDLFQAGMRQMAAQQWKEAEETFRQVVAMADVLPQPWSNLGVALIAQGRFDEAEDALQTALELDPDYEFAQRNLAMLPLWQTEERPLSIGIVGPFDDQEIEVSIVRAED